MNRTKALFIFIILLGVWAAAPAAALEEGRFFTYPTIQGDRIVFTYESDLWADR